MKMVRKSVVLGGAIAALAFACGSANAAFSNFGPGFDFNAGASHGFFPFQPAAMGFVAGATGNVTDIYFAVSGFGTHTVRIYEAEDDWTQGAMLGQWSISGITGPAAVRHIAVDGGPQLFQGGQYWLWIDGDPQSETQSSWFHNSVGGTGPTLLANQFNPDGVQGAFAVVVPAPGALALLALAGVAAPRRRRQ